jgi:L,D-peptidoglycan transpeptidase YkuD (ErfK/YbiS/YcfS/YnhG family)
VQIFSASSSGFLSYRTNDEVVQVRCALGKGGIVPAIDKREGDGASPIGNWPIRRVMFRADKLAPPHTSLPLTDIQPQDGWCDSADDDNYNLPVTHPYSASAERLWRDDDVYDVVVVLGHNDDPVVAELGSAIFMHVARPDYTPTEGCVALAKDDLLALLAVAQVGDVVEIGA